ncbi:DUF7344 domain-containing protein [Halorarum halobium]|uniref:DUF7344 domain-containing protein n=1 Tax=Halorarum halobium TaxID=3075121 RepID=UPI0028A85D82|nr:hypothetical protein [Halobaculum sp. XH14]
MDRQQSTHPDRMSQLLSTLATEESRATLDYFQSTSDDMASVAELADELNEYGTKDTERIAIQLHHSTLPKLADVGAVEYDPRSRTVRYRGHDELELLLGGIQTAERRMDCPC